MLWLEGRWRAKGMIGGREEGGLGPWRVAYQGCRGTGDG